jgi:hypothetical protein
VEEWAAIQKDEHVVQERNRCKRFKDHVVRRGDERSFGDNMNQEKI